MSSFIFGIEFEISQSESIRHGRIGLGEDKKDLPSMFRIDWKGSLVVIENPCVLVAQVKCLSYCTGKPRVDMTWSTC